MEGIMNNSKQDLKDTFNKLKETVTIQVEKAIKNMHLPSKEEVQKKLKDLGKDYESELLNLKKKYEKDLLSLRTLIEDVVSKSVDTMMKYRPTKTTTKRNSPKKTQKITSREP